MKHYFSVVRNPASDYPDERYLFVFKDESKREVIYFLDADSNQSDLIKIMAKVIMLRTPFHLQSDTWRDGGDLGWAQETWDSMIEGGGMDGIVIFDETTPRSEMQTTADRKEIILISGISHLYPAPDVKKTLKNKLASD